MAQIPPATPAEVPPRVEMLSADDWLALPDAHRHHELMAGHLTLVQSPDLRYDLIASDLTRAIRRAMSSSEKGGMVVSQTGFVVSASGEDQTVLVPALAFISAERLARESLTASAPVGMHAGALLRMAPDVVVEIASPSQRASEFAERVLLWKAAGARLVWVVWPARRQVEVWTVDAAETPEAQPRTLSAHDTLDGGAVLADFTYAVAHLFL